MSTPACTADCEMTLELRPNCEYCDVDLPPQSTEARICTYECTFCRVVHRRGALQRVPELRRWIRAQADPAER